MTLVFLIAATRRTGLGWADRLVRRTVSSVRTEKKRGRGSTDCLWEPWLLQIKGVLPSTEKGNGIWNLG